MAAKYWQGSRRDMQRNVIIPDQEWAYLVERAIAAKQPVSRWLTVLLRNNRKHWNRRHVTQLPVSTPDDE